VTSMVVWIMFDFYGKIALIFVELFKIWTLFFVLFFLPFQILSLCTMFHLPPPMVLKIPCFCSAFFTFRFSLPV
jgi:hypothetical protein